MIEKLTRERVSESDRETGGDRQRETEPKWEGFSEREGGEGGGARKGGGAARTLIRIKSNLATTSN